MIKKNKKYLIVLFICHCVLYMLPGIESHGANQPYLILDHGNPVSAMVFSSDSSKLITGWGESFIWDMNTGKKLLTIPSQAASSVAFSLDDKYVATGTSPLSATLWDVETGENIRNYKGIDDPYLGPTIITALAFHPYDPVLIMETQREEILLWNTKTGDVTPLIQSIQSYNKIYVFSDGDRLAVDDKIISMSNKAVLHQFISRIHITSDEKQVVCQRGYIDGDFNKRQVVSYSADDYQLIKEYPVFTCESGNTIFSPNGSFLLINNASTLKGNAQLMSVNTNQIVHEFSVAGKEELIVIKALFSPDSQKVAITSGETIYVWDISDLYSSVDNAEELKQ